MSTRPMLAGLILIASTFFEGQSHGADSFADFVNRVERRDSMTKAICEIRVEDTALGNPKVEVKENIATFEFSRNFKNGNRVEKFPFPVTDDVLREVRRIQNYHEMISLKAKADAAINAYRVFLVSDFRIRVGDTLENADIQMGIRRKMHPNQGQWAERTLYLYDDGLTVECIGGVVQGAWRDPVK